MNKIVAFAIGIIISTNGFCKKGPARYFGEPVWTDSLSTLFIPTRYNEEFLSTNKIAMWGDYYANIIAYNFKEDTYKKLFEKDTYIETFRMTGDSFQRPSARKVENITSKWVFLLVKIKDTNGSGRIDERDPSVLFAASLDGRMQKQLTETTENVTSFTIYEKQGFLLLRIQKDSDNDKSFKNEDKEFFFKKVNMTDLALGNPIEVK